MVYHILVDRLHNLRLDNQTDVQWVCETTQYEEKHINCILTTLRHLCTRGFANMGVYYDVEIEGADTAGSRLSSDAETSCLCSACTCTAHTPSFSVVRPHTQHTEDDTTRSISHELAECGRIAYPNGCTSSFLAPDRTHIAWFGTISTKAKS
jgi:hypothetical protein